MMAVDLTLDQQELLNNISKYEPAWRGFGNLGSGFGDKMKAITVEMISLRDDIDVEIVGIKEIDFSFSSGSQIEVFNGTSEVFVSDIAVQIIQPFNSSASLSIGTDSNPELLFLLAESDLNETNEFITFPKIKTSDVIKVFFNSASSGSGLGKIFINLR